MRRELLTGIAAGAAGTTALNAVTYLDMVVRARPASSTPQQTVRRAEELTHVTLSDQGPDSEPAKNRRSGFGSLLGIPAGLCAGAVYGVARARLSNVPLPLRGVAAGLTANIASTGPMALLGVTDPRSWPASSWLSDVVPHLAFGLATAAVYERMQPADR